MPTPLTKMTTANLNALLTTQLGSLRPYQLEQVLDVLRRTNWEKGNVKDMSLQPTISTIATALGANNP